MFGNNTFGQGQFNIPKTFEKQQGVFGNTPTSGGLFGTSNLGKNNDFLENQNNTGTIFGKNLFGQSQTPSFGQSQTSPFGQSQTSPFGQTQPTAFGQKPNTPFGQSQSSPFGQSQSSPFGQPPQSSPFGQTQATPFGQPPQSSPFGQTQATPFGQPPQSSPFAQTQSSPFGQTQSSPFGQPPQSSPFGQPPQSSPFGQPPQSSPFGQTQLSYGQPKLTGDIFGKETFNYGQSQSDQGTTFKQFQLAKNVKGQTIYTITYQKEYNSIPLSILRLEDYILYKENKLKDPMIQNEFKNYESIQAGGAPLNTNPQSYMNTGGIFGTSNIYDPNKKSVQSNLMSLNPTGLTQSNVISNTPIALGPPEQKTTGGLFGTNQTQTGGLFGEKSQNVGLFGTSQNQPSQTGGLFGNTPQSQSTGTFGQTTQNQMGGLFGTSQSQTGGPFMEKSQNVGLFGIPQNQPSQQNEGLFGTNQTQTGGLFGEKSQNVGLFGTSQNQPSQTGGLFGNTPQSQSTGTFGQTTQNQMGGLFGTSQNQTGGLFGEKSQNVGLFGIPQNQPSQQTEGLFGTNQTQTGGLFGEKSQNVGLFGTSQTGGLFGSTPQSQSTGTFGLSQPQSSLFKTPQNQTTGSLFTPPSQQNQPSMGLFNPSQNIQAPQQTSTPPLPMQGFSGDSPYAIFYVPIKDGRDIFNLNEKYFPTLKQQERKKFREIDFGAVDTFRDDIAEEETNRSVFYDLPKIGTVSHRGDYKKYLDAKEKLKSKLITSDILPTKRMQKKELKAKFPQKKSSFVYQSIQEEKKDYNKINLKISFNKGSEIPIMKTGQFDKDEILGKIINFIYNNFQIKKNQMRDIKLVYQGQELDNCYLLSDYNIREGDTIDAILDVEKNIIRNLPSKLILPVRSKKFFTIPSYEDMCLMSEQELSKIYNFTVFNENGKITFLGETDVRGLIIDKIIDIKPKQIEVYPEDVFDEEQKPEIGQELNKKAQLYLYNLQPPRDTSFKKYLRKLQQIVADMQATFIDYDREEGTLVLEVDHF